MTRPWLAVILLVIISGNLGNRYDVTDVDQLRVYYFYLNFMFQSFEKYGTEFTEETFLKFCKYYRKLDTELDGASGMTSKDLVKSRNSLLLWKKVQVEINHINGLHETFRRKLHETDKTGSPFNDKQSMDFAKTVLEDSNISVPSAMERIYDKVQFFFTSSYEDLKAASQICPEKKSPQQLLYNFYKIIALTGIKGSIVMQFSSKFLGLHENATLRDEFIKTDVEYNLHTNKILRIVKTVIATTPRVFWRCEPSVHKEDSTYTELKELIQGYIVNEVDLSPTGSCWENCAFYSDATVHGCYANQFCAQQRRCNGKVRDCQYKPDMLICQPKNESSRRYESIAFNDGSLFGRGGYCPVNRQIGVHGWFRWFVHCSYCICYCDDDHDSSDRYFSLKEVTSNVKKNRVVTGIKLTKMNKVIHLQIQEGKLLRRGKILEDSVQWKDVDNFTVMDRNVKNGRDYHRLDWENRALDLDDLAAPESHLLTGLRFRLIGTHLHLDIRVTSFNFTTGILTGKSTWLNNDTIDIKDPAAVEKARTEFKLPEPDVPTRLKTRALPDSKPNQYLNFGPTDLEKDAAQTIIPFLDIQPVTTNPPFPLSGAGIFHKGSDGSGGFVALRVITYDISNHLSIAPELGPLPIIENNEIPNL